MKNRRLLSSLAFAAAVAFGLALPAKAADLVVNGGFETGDLTGWTQSTGWVGADWPPYSGTYAYWNGRVGSLGYLDQVLPTTPGESYTLDFWLRNGVAGGGTPNQFLVSWGGSSIDGFSNSGPFGWTEYTYTGLMATTGATTLEFGFRQDPDYLGLDDVSVQASGVPDSTFTASLLSLGLLGLAALRRKLR